MAEQLIKIYHSNFCLLLLTDFRGLDLRSDFFKLREIETATNNFSIANKIGEGGFDPIYKVGLITENDMLY